MKGALDSLGVKPKERRAVILMLMGFFLVGNVIWLVFEIPTLIQTQTKLSKYEQENKKELSPPKGERGLKEKLKDKRTDVETQKGDTKKIKDGEEAANLIDLVERQALISGLNLGTSRGGQGSRLRDKDFEEFKRTIKFTGNLMDLTTFLKKMSEEKSMIRVSDMTIQPTRDKKLLAVDLTFVASYPVSEPESKSKSKKKGKKK
jgi:Tfp pilus assembly protein PilO